jgi:NitT/TauT family transport system permease protein
MRHHVVGIGRVLVIAALAVTWELVSRLHLVDTDVLPPLTHVLAVLWRLLQDPAFLTDIRVTVIECLIAFAVVVPLGLLVGFILGESHRLERALGPPLQLMMTVPKSVFLPVFIFMLGLGLLQKVVFAVVLAFFIVVPSGIAAVHSVPRGLVAAARSFGATRPQIFLHIYIPAMAPLILGAVRLGSIFVVHGVVFAEMYGSVEGVGRSILAWGEAFQMDHLLAAVLLVLLFTVVLNETMQTLERYAGGRREVAS